MAPIRTARRLVVLTAATFAVVVGIAGSASADDAVTTTGQTLTITVGAGGLDQPQLVAYGTTRITSGSATIKSVEVRFNDSDPVPVELDAKGHFRKGVVMSFDATQAEIEAVATASDGTTVNALVVISTDGAVTRPDSPDKDRGKAKVMPNTGATDPPVLGPIGLAMVALGSVLVWRNRRPSSS